MQQTRVFVHASTRMAEVDRLRGKGPDDLNFGMFTDAETLASLLHRAGLFPTVEEACAYGLDRPVPRGLTSFLTGDDGEPIRILGRVA